MDVCRGFICYPASAQLAKQAQTFQKHFCLSQHSLLLFVSANANKLCLTSVLNKELQKILVCYPLF